MSIIGPSPEPLPAALPPPTLTPTAPPATDTPGAAGGRATSARRLGPAGEWAVLARVAGVVAAIICAARAVALFRGQEAPGLLANPFLWLVLGAALFGLATASLMVEPRWVRPDEASPPAPIDGSLLRAALVTAGFTMVAYWLALMPMLLLILAWLAAQALLVAALVRWRWPWRWPALTRRQWLQEGTAAAVLAIAAGFRFWNPTGVPLAIHGDMTSYGLMGREILNGQHPDFFGTAWYAIPVLGFIPQAISMFLLGDNLVGLNAWPALAGVGSLVALYLLTRDMLGWRPAILATIIAAGDLVHIHYSRSTGYMDPVLFVAVAVLFMARGLRGGHLWTFAAAGIVAGYGVQTYFAGRIVLPVLLALIVLSALAGPRALWRRRLGLGFFAIGLLITIGPAFLFYLKAPHTFNERTSQVLLFEPGVWQHTARKYGLAESDVVGVLTEQFERAALLFWRYTDSATQFGIPRVMFDPIVGVLLILGLGYVVLRPLQPALTFPLVWGLGYVISSALTLDPPASMRTVALSLPVAILAGVTLDRALTVVFPDRRWLPTAIIAAVVISGAVAARNWSDYYAWATGPQHVSPRVQIARFIMARPGNHLIVVTSQEFNWHDREFEFLLVGREGTTIKPEAYEEMADSETWPPAPVMFVLTPDARDRLAMLQEHYPQGRIIDGSLPPRDGVFFAFIVDAP